MLCVQGSCTKWHALSLVHGASIYSKLLGLHGFLVCVTIVFLVSGFVILL